MIPPTISIIATEDDRYALYATSYGRTEPAGERLLHVAKGQSYPEIQFTSDTLEEAEKEKSKLQAHLTSWGKPPSKTKLRARGE